MAGTAPVFDRFLGIDWSGAAGTAYDGVAVAACAPGGSGPALVPPPGGARRWTRTAVLDLLLSETASARVLAGIDCAFSLPFGRADGYFRRPSGAPDLWALVDGVSSHAPDLSGAPFAAHPAFADGFWTAGRRPEGFVLPCRATEDACRADGLGSPESPYKLIGAKQVGKGGLAGMRLLHALRTAAGDRVAVWPFDPADDGRSVVAEIYPRLFLKRAGAGNAKLRTRADLDRALAELGSGPAEGLGRDPTDHEADALVSAAGLRLLAADPRVWSPPGLDERARRQEGWILGVGCGVGPGAG